jgi:hypothetical protein
MPSFKPSIVIGYPQFANLLLGDLSKLYREIEEISHLVRRASNYEYDNNIFRISSSYGTEFKVLFSTHSISIWDIHDFSVATELLPDKLEDRKKVISRIGYKLTKYDQGFIDCSKCGKEIELQLHSGNRFYGGIYCNSCWENGVRQQEAKENYD